ncbi:MAG TPA: DUF4352 domain-containing protein [Dictyobacter sp.]|nr:DUF4352 domain-containing protein [Dictyobacter sp.]
MLKKLLPFALLALIVGALIACGASDNTGTAVSSTNAKAAGSSPTASASSQHFKVGQTVKVGDTWNVVVKSVKDSAGSQYQQPTKGTFLEIQVQATNISNQEQTLSSLADFTLRDDQGNSYTETFLTDDAGNAINAPDGKVESGSPIQGTFVYDVPKATKFTFAFAPSLLSSGQTTWDVKS